MAMDSYMKKIRKFMYSEDKAFILRNKILEVKQVFFKHKYKSFGRKSIIDRPMRLIGTKRIEIGDNVGILPNARIEIISSYNGQPLESGLTIGNRTSIGQNFHCVAGGMLHIGNDVTISGNVFLADVAHDYSEIDVHSLKQKLIFKETYIGDFCFIGYGAAIQPGVRLGKQCIVGANSTVLAGNYPDYSVLAGSPAKIVKRYKSSGTWEKNSFIVQPTLVEGVNYSEY